MSGFVRDYRYHVLVVLYAVFVGGALAGVHQGVLASRVFIPFAVPIVLTAVAAPSRVYRLLSLILLATSFAALLLDSPDSARNWQLFLLMWGVLILAAEILRWLAERSRRVEAALRQSQQQLDSFFAQSMDGFFIMMMDKPARWDETVNKDATLEYIFDHQRVTQINDAMLKQYGAERADFMAKTPRELFAHDLEEGRAAWHKMLDEGSVHLVTEERKVDGTPIWIEGVYTCLYDEAGRMVGHSGVQREITAQKETLEQLRLFQAVAEASAEAIAISEPGGRLSYVNPAHRRLFGYPDAEAAHKHYREFFPAATLAFIDREVDPALRSGERWEGDLIAKRADGSHFILRSSLGSLLDEQGELLYGFAFMQDVTARREAEAAERRQRLMAELLEETAVLLTGSLQFDSVIEAILDNVARVIPHHSAALFLLNEADTLFRLYIIQEEDGRAVHSHPLAFSLSQVPMLQQMAQSGEPYLVDDVQRYPPWLDHPYASWARSFIGAPLGGDEETVGFLALLSDEKAHFRPDHLGFLRAFAAQATIAIQNANCHAEEIERRESLEALQQAGLCLTSSLELPQVLDKILQAIFDLVEAKNAYIFLLANGRLVFEAGLTESGPVSQPFAPPRPEGITYTALRRGEPIVVQDSRTAPVFAGAPPDWGRFSMVSLPIQFKGETFGVVNVAGSVERPFTPLKCRTLDTLAAYAAVAIQNARLHAQVRRHAAELEQRVTERTAELRQERNRLQAILDNVGDGIFFADKQGKIRFANPALEEITGYPDDALMGQKANVWRGATSPAVLADLDGAIAAESSWSGEVINRRRDGTLYDAYVTITPLFDEAGAFRGYVGSQRDITHLKELNRLKDQFVSRIGHELITPITTLLLYLDLITYSKNKDHTAYLKTLRQEAERLNKLVRGFLRLADLNTDASQVNLASHVVVDLLREALPAWQTQAERRNLTLDTNFSANSAAALADADLLLEAVELLLDNSFNYTPDYGCVVLTVSRRRRKRPWVTITVTDTGPGLLPDEAPHIFDRFYRGKVTEEYDVPGAGLGLAICQEIMENLEGRITVDGNFGHGASFTLWLKSAPAPGA